MATLLKDLRLGVRMLFKYPELTGVAVFALSLGIGLTTVMYSIVYGTLLRGLPFEDAERLVRLERSKPAEGVERMPVTLHDFVAWQARQLSFEDLAAWYGKSIHLSELTSGPGRYNGAYVSTHMFDLLRVEPQLGRVFRPCDVEPGAPGVVVIGHDIWQSRFDGDSRIIGRSLRVDGETRTLIGVMPEGFGFPLRQEIWLPLRRDTSRIERGEGTPLEVFGRLRPGVSSAEADRDVKHIAEQLAAEHPATNRGISALVEPYIETYTGKSLQAYLYTMLGAVFGVLLIACANVTNLLLARVALRSRDVAIRTALGASRFRLVCQLLSETFVLALAGGLLGLVLARLGIDLYNAMIAERILSFWMDVRFDPQIFLFVLGITALTSLISGLAPALRASGADTNEMLKDLASGPASRSAGRLRRAIVVAELALSCGLLVATGLMIKSVVNLKTLDFGFATDDVLTAQISLLPSDYPDAASELCFFDELEARLASLPGAAAVAFTSSLPGQPTSRVAFEIAGREGGDPAERRTTRWAVISPGFFETFDVKPLWGRAFAVADDAHAEPVALVNQSFAERHFPGESPIGNRLRLLSSRAELEAATVIGVVPDLAMDGIDGEDAAGIYLPLAQHPRGWMSVAIRGRVDPLSLTPAVRREVATLDRNLPLFWVMTMSEAMDGAYWHYATFGTLFTIFGLVALLLATIGLYGVMTLAANQRVQECGLRMALGARSDDVQQLILRGGVRQLSLGVVLGLGLAAALSRLLTAFLFRVEPWDFSVFAFVAVVLVSAGLLACWIPAQRTGRVDPMVALRNE